MTCTADAQIMELWLRRQQSPHTRSCYRRDIRRLDAFTRKPLAALVLADLDGFAQSLERAGLAPISRARTLAAVRSLLAFAHRVGYLPVNSASEMLLPRSEDRLAERIISERDVAGMIAGELVPRNRTLLRLLYGAGLRVSEACELRWRNTRPHGDAGQITVFGKNSRTRTIARSAMEPPLRRRFSIHGRASPWIAGVSTESYGPQPNAQESRRLLARIGCGTRTRRTPSIEERRSTWFKQPSDTALWRPPAATFTPDPATPAPASCRCEESCSGLQNCLCFSSDLSD